MASSAKVRSTPIGSFDFRSVARRLRQSTMLTRTDATSYSNFGVLAAMEVGAVAGLHARFRNVAEAAVFTVDEARNRLKEIVTGRFRPRTMRELDRHLGERRMAVEIRAYGSGPATTYLVDKVTRGAVPAAQIHRSLSAAALERRFGAAVTPPGMRPSERPSPPDPNVVRIRRLLHGIFPLSKDTPPFDSWEQLQMSLPVLTDGLAYTVQGGKGYIGRAFGTASSDPAENLQLLDEARRQGLRLVLPAEDRDQALAGRLVPGMPVLVASDSVLAKKVDPRLDHTFMANAFGVSFSDNIHAIRSRAEEREMFTTTASNVVKLAQFRVEEFSTKFARAPELAAAVRGGALPPKLSVRSTQTMEGVEVLTAWNGDKGMEVGPASTMPPGTYLKECAFEIPRGYVRVDEAGAVHHFSMDMRPHNPNGPAVVHPPGSGRPNEWALDGVMLTDREFLKRTAEDGRIHDPEPAVGMNEVARSRAFG